MRAFVLGCWLLGFKGKGCFLAVEMERFLLGWVPPKMGADDCCSVFVFCFFIFCWGLDEGGVGVSEQAHLELDFSFFTPLLNLFSVNFHGMPNLETYLFYLFNKPSSYFQWKTL